ncbi:MAG: hypothetical protein Kow0010_15930 [Dehalococcoidia bacterium]
MRTRLLLAASVIIAVAAGFGTLAAFESRMLALGIGVVAGYFAWGELSDVFGVNRRTEPLARDMPLLQHPVFRRRLITLAAVGGATVLILYELLVGDFETEEVRDWVDGLGIWGPILLIGVLAAAMVFAPIPNPPFMIAAGLVWGIFLGVVYSVIGQLIGAAIIFWISRKAGRRFIPRLIGHEGARRVDQLANEMGPQLIFWWRMMPISFDFAAYAAGLTAISFRLFITLVFLGSLLPTTVVVAFGDSFNRSWTARAVTAAIVLVAVSVPATIMYLRYRERLPAPREMLRMALAGGTGSPAQQRGQAPPSSELR